jgi:tyrosinase
LSPAERKAFAAAVLQLKSQPSRLTPTDAQRGRYDDFVEVHLNAMAVMNATPPGQSWGHMAAAFGPWHRVFLHHFESELQQIDPNVTLPYWDWPADHDAASPIWGPDFLGGNGQGADGRVPDGPFAGSTGSWPLRVLDDPQNHPRYLTRFLGQAADAKTLPTSSMVTSALATTPYDSAPWEDMMRDQNDPSQWSGFRMQLEVNLHNLVHRWVGGAMVAMASPNDPVFWLHHSNIDRLWSNWIRSHQDQSPYLPVSGGPQGHNLYDSMIFHAAGDPPPWDGNARPVDVLDHHALGYRYDTDPPNEDKLPMGSIPAQERLLAHPAPREAVSLPARQSLPLFVLRGEIPALSKSGA